MSVEKLIFSNLVYNEDYGRKAIPFLREEYFHDVADRTVFGLMHEYVEKYNSFPSKEALGIDLANKSLGDQTFKQAKEVIESLSAEETKLDWLLDQTEKFCQEKAIYNGIMQSIQILDDKTGERAKGSIPKILSDALGVSFDTSIGHDFLEDSNSRFEFYHTKEVRIPFDMDYFNKITGGGLPRKTLNIALAGTGVGKSLFMCHCASANLLGGLNVLYITLEMSEEKIAERIDANLLDIPMSELGTIPKDMYERRVSKLKSTAKGKLIIKEYPTACAGSGNFRHLLNELKLKKNFIPDVIYIDYLNICMSSRLKAGNNINSYTYVKAIAEELRGLAVEFNVPVISATQTTRSGYSSSDVGLEDTSESFGLPATADLMFALIATDELSEQNQIMVKQLKNRFSDPASIRKFIIGIDKTKMRLFDVEQKEQEGLTDGPLMDKTKFGTEDRERSKKVGKFDRKKLEGFS